VASQGSLAARQQRFSNVEGVVAVPNAVSVEPHELPAGGFAQQFGPAAPGVHIALFVSVQAVPVAQTPLLQARPLHDLPHVPQLDGSLSVFTHVFVAAQKSGVAVAQPHVPSARHVSGGAHVPVGGGAHAAVAAHIPFTQAIPLHDMPHDPQFVGSVLVFAQVLVAEQYVSSEFEHPHAPPWHVSGAEQIEPGHAAPQWLESVARSTQPTAPPQSVSPAAQPHFPATHDSPALQATPQPPQFFGSVCSFEHAPTVPPMGMQSVVGAPQPHTPPPHGTPAGQTFPQVPQLAASDWVLMHFPSQKLKPGTHPHAPFTHTSPWPQMLLHSPQLAGSVFPSTQAAPHDKRPVPQPVGCT
jgi:hypothetical protein